VSTAAIQKLAEPLPSPTIAGTGAGEIRYRIWAPPESPIEVEYSDELIREVRLTSLLGNANGVLYGSRHGNWIRLVAARRVLNNGGFEGDPRLAGLEPIGVFFARPRGQVFLTESDLERLDESDGAVALVVAGSRAGFFVFEADGSIDAIKSQGEFAVPEIAPLARMVEPPRFVLEPERRGAWVWMMPVAILAMAGVLLTQPYWRLRPAIELTAQDDAGQIRIRWNRAAATEAGFRLEIADGSAQVSIPVSPEFASATYLRHTGDVQIHLTSGSRTESIRFFGTETAPTHVDLIRQEVNQLEAEAQALDTDLERGSRRIARLRDSIASLIHAP
jgi:hypothetical protein